MKNVLPYQNIVYFYIRNQNNQKLKIKTMKNSIHISDFTFQFAGYGHYLVTYTSPVTLKSFSKTISEMSLIDATKNEDEPKKCDLLELKRICKSK